MKHTIFTYVQLFSRQLEESLELMSSEFESMEDYWQQKLDSERSFGEEQLKSSESQFRELEARLREYEDLLVAAEASDSEHKSGVLSTIEEDRDLEEKVSEKCFCCCWCIFPAQDAVWPGGACVGGKELKP